MYRRELVLHLFLNSKEFIRNLCYRYIWELCLENIHFFHTNPQLYSICDFKIHNLQFPLIKKKVSSKRPFFPHKHIYDRNSPMTICRYAVVFENFLGILVMFIQVYLIFTTAAYEGRIMSWLVWTWFFTFEPSKKKNKGAGSVGFSLLKEEYQNWIPNNSHGGLKIKVKLTEN